MTGNHKEPQLLWDGCGGDSERIHVELETWLKEPVQGLVVCQPRQQQINHQNPPQTPHKRCEPLRARWTPPSSSTEIHHAAFAPSSNLNKDAEESGGEAAADVLGAAHLDPVPTSSSILAYPIFPQRLLFPSSSSRPPPDFPRLPPTSRRSWMKVKHVLTYLSPIGYCIIYSSLSIVPTPLISVPITIPTSTVLLPV